MWPIDLPALLKHIISQKKLLIIGAIVFCIGENWAVYCKGGISNLDVITGTDPYKSNRQLLKFKIADFETSPVLLVFILLKHPHLKKLFQLFMEKVCSQAVHY
jgi:hypothetical protein